MCRVEVPELFNSPSTPAEAERIASWSTSAAGMRTPRIIPGQQQQRQPLTQQQNLSRGQQGQSLRQGQGKSSTLHAQNAPSAARPEPRSGSLATVGAMTGSARQNSTVAQQPRRPHLTARQGNPARSGIPDPGAIIGRPALSLDYLRAHTASPATQAQRAAVIAEWEHSKQSAIAAAARRVMVAKPCPVCKKPAMEDPWSASCGHQACYGCWLKALAAMVCPVCGKRTHKRTLTKAYFK